MTMKHVPTLAAILLVCLCAAETARADGYGDPSGQYLNLGVRLAWDTEGGPVQWGLEASWSWYRDDETTHGVVLDVDWVRRGTRWQLGYEIVPRASGTVGFETGPSLLVNDGATLGWHVSTFAGFIVYPFSQATYFPGDLSHEIGFMAKLPIPALRLDE
jgi:hypothetical protein